MSRKIYKDVLALRKEFAKKSLLAFAKTYFKHYCTLDFAPFQLELIKYLEESVSERGKQLAVAAPRGNAKSSLVSLIYVLWCACYKFESCIVIFSSTKDLSEKLLSHIKDELSSNAELIKDFPEVCVPPNPRWRKDEIITKNDVNIRISSQDHSIRGVRFRSHRPTLVLLDDVESTESTRSQEGREKILDWFSKVVLNLGSKTTNYIAVGTIIHFDSLLAKLTSKEREIFPGFERKIYKSVIKWAKGQDLWDQWSRYYCSKDFYNGKAGPAAAKKFFSENSKSMLEGTVVLWPEMESYYDLMIVREENGNFSFESEKQNEPKDPGTLSLDMNTVEWWDKRFQVKDDLVTHLQGRMVTMGAVDPAIGKGKNHDFSAIITVFVDRSNRDIYVIDADVGRWDLDTLVKRICLHNQTSRYSCFFYEANAAQAWLGDSIKKEPSNIPIKPITNTRSKEGRIAKLMLLIQRGKVKLSTRLTELNRQLSNYPNGAHDDAIDALAMLADMVDDVRHYDPEQMKELFLRIQFPGYDPKNPKKIIGKIDKKGKFGSIDDPFGLLSIK